MRYSPSSTMSQKKEFPGASSMEYGVTSLFTLADFDLQLRRDTQPADAALPPTVGIPWFLAAFLTSWCRNPPRLLLDGQNLPGLRRRKMQSFGRRERHIVWEYQVTGATPRKALVFSGGSRWPPPIWSYIRQYLLLGRIQRRRNMDPGLGEWVEPRGRCPQNSVSSISASNMRPVGAGQYRCAGCRQRGKSLGVSDQEVPNMALPVYWKWSVGLIHHVGDG